MSAKGSAKKSTRHTRSDSPAPTQAVSRKEFNRVIDLLELRGQAISALQHELDLTVKRIAQQQVEIDGLKRQMPNNMKK